MHYLIFRNNGIIRHCAITGDRQHARVAVEAPRDMVALRRAAVAGRRGLDGRFRLPRHQLILLFVFCHCRYRQ